MLQVRLSDNANQNNNEVSLTPVRMATIRKKKQLYAINAGEVWRKGKLSTLLAEM